MNDDQPQAPSSPDTEARAPAGRAIPFAVTLVLVIGLLVTIVLSVALRAQASQRDRIRLEARVGEAAERVQAVALQAFDAGVAVRSIISQNPQLTQEEFQGYMTEGGVLQAFPRVTALSFARWHAADNAVVIELIAPLLGNEAALGLDLLSEENRRAATERARDQGLPTASAPISLVQDQSGKPSLLLAVPIYAGGQNHPTGPERRRNFLGVVSVVMRADVLLSGVLPAGATIDLRIQDVGPVDADGSQEPFLLHTVGDPTPGAPEATADTVVGDRRWRLIATPSRLFVGGTPTWAVAAISGVILTFALTALLRTQRSARRDAERLVERRTVELRRANDQLREADREKTAFLSTVSHELRTPLTAITGFITMLRNPQLAQSESVRADLLERMDRNARSLTSLIEEVLAFSRLEARPDELPLEDADVGLIVASTLDALGPLLAQAQVETTTPPGLTAQVNRDALHRIVANLVTNAAKYGGKDVRIEVSTTRVGDDVVVRVTDDGPGIAPADRAKVFDRFYRGQQTQGTPGTGIGLAVVRETATLLGGSATLDESTDSGTSFVITLPLSPQATGSNSNGPAAEADT